MIISRYLAKEVYSALFATILVLLVIFISNQVVRYLQDAAAGELSGHAVALLVLLQLPHLLSLLLPLSLFLAILISYGRLYADNEMTILISCGVSPLKLLDTTLKFSLVVVVIVGILALWVEPKVSRYTDQILAGETSSALELLAPNRFQPINNGKWIVYVSKTSRDKTKLNNIFAAEQYYPASSSATLHPLRVIAAQGGYQLTDHDNGESYLVLTNGYRYEGIPGKKDFRIMQYAEYGIKLQHPSANDDVKTSEDNAPTSALWQNRHDKLSATELEWRISMPLTAIILAFLAVALSKIKPKHGRYAKLVPATICYITYAQLIFLSRAWMKKGFLPPLFGMWWVHVLALGFAVFLIIKQNTRKV